ncbi:MAG: trypsin-like peptidase domain-containing protein [Desulfomonile tiedjei]|uniref:Trypsin-like peptidase domain-containing protein n=1 Tax=Desulfomonile tiedjei TaxID=2358 RepID=A0A9D6V4F0_9BACT|nr:trypsin-like peptidase domain-containing protein [Desulfomonile tiedjei]
MSRFRRTSVIVTFVVIFSVGVVLGLWLNKKAPRPAMVIMPPPPKYEALESGEAVVMRVYQAISPAVVNIVATSLAMNFWMQLVPQTGQGTGFVIDADGHILTNNHVVANAEVLEVTFLGEKKVQARLVGRDPVSDLAVIKITPFPEMQVAPMGNSDVLSVGQRVIAIGNPFGFQHTVTAGFISALNRDLTIGQRTMMGMIQTDAAINPGNSGGPLIDSRGQVIAINTAIYTQSGGFMGIGLAVPINRAKKVAVQIVRFGRAIYPWLGITSWMDMEPRVAELMGMKPVRGILIFEIGAGSPAARAGLKGGTQLAYYQGRPVAIKGRPLVLGGDVILALNDSATPTFDDLQNLILEKNVGDQVRLKVLRGQQELNVDVILSEDPRMTR